MGSSLNTQKRQKKEVEQSRRQDVQEQATEVCVLMNVMQVWRSITADSRTASKQKRTKEQAPAEQRRKSDKRMLDKHRQAESRTAFGLFL